MKPLKSLSKKCWAWVKGEMEEMRSNRDDGSYQVSPEGPRQKLTPSCVHSFIHSVPALYPESGSYGHQTFLKFSTKYSTPRAKL